MDSQVDDELLDILKNSSVIIDARYKGWEYVLGMTVSEDGLSHILRSKKYLPFTLSYIQENRHEKELIHLAYKCLINISNHERGALALKSHKKDLIAYFLNSIADSIHNFTEVQCYILSNLSAYPEINKEIIDVVSTSENLLSKLMKNFCSNDSQIRRKCDFLCLVFANFSYHSAGRSLFLQDKDFMNGIFACVSDSESDVRRLGAALTLRNCCLETDCHGHLLDELDILPVLLLPLMGPEEYEEEEMDKLPLDCQCLDETKEREKSAQVRKILVQAITLLCYSEKGWNYLKAKGVYYVARELHKWEKDSTVTEAIETLVTYLLVEQYSSPKNDSRSVSEELMLIKQLEADILKDLPDFVI